MVYLSRRGALINILSSAEMCAFHNHKGPVVFPHWHLTRNGNIHFPFIEIVWWHKENCPCRAGIKSFWLEADADSHSYGNISHHTAQLIWLSLVGRLYTQRELASFRVVVFFFPLLVHPWFLPNCVCDVKARRKGWLSSEKPGADISFQPDY